MQDPGGQALPAEPGDERKKLTTKTPSPTVGAVREPPLQIIRPARMCVHLCPLRINLFFSVSSLVESFSFLLFLVPWGPSANNRCSEGAVRFRGAGVPACGQWPARRLAPPRSVTADTVIGGQSLSVFVARFPLSSRLPPGGHMGPRLHSVGQDTSVPRQRRLDPATFRKACHARVNSSE